MKFYISLVIILIWTKQSNCYPDYYYDEYDQNQYTFSTPEECARMCVDGEPPKYCYYHFHLEWYTTVGPACDVREQRGQCIVADGVERTITSINRQLPGPAIEVCKGDYIIVDAENGVLGQEVVLHWHGIFQNGYQYYDGVPYVTQCPIPSSSTFRYQFAANNAGTHFYHSHISTHMGDGQYGSLIIRNPPSEEPFLNMYDVDDRTLLISDWTHELSSERFPGWYRHDIGQTAKNLLINGRGNWTDPDTKQTTNADLTVHTVTSGKRYRFRLINSMSTVCVAQLSIESHNLTIIAQDGANVKPVVVNSIVTVSGERVDFILHADQPVKSYWIQVHGLGECSEKKVQQLAFLKYDGAPLFPPTPAPQYENMPTGVVYNSLDATRCDTQDTSQAVCVNQLESLEEDDDDLLKVTPDARHILDFWFFNYTQYGDRLLFQSNTFYEYFSATDKSQLLSMFNDISFQSPASPLISQNSAYETICMQNQPSNCTQPCTCTQVIYAQLNSVVELLIYDRIPLEGLDHPFHLHGYEFKVLSIGQFADGRNISRQDIENILAEHNNRLEQGQYRNPPGKDTVKIPQGGYAIIRFRANNPGWWLLHCHFTWHHITGMELVVNVGSQNDLPPVPPDFPKCSNWRPPLQTLNDFYGFRYP